MLEIIRSCKCRQCQPYCTSYGDRDYSGLCSGCAYGRHQGKSNNKE